MVRWPAEDGEEPADALAAAAVHLVGHGRRADLAGTEALGGQLLARHQPDGEWRGRPGRRPPAPARVTTSRSSERGYTWPTLVSTASNPRCSAMRRSSRSRRSASPSSRSSMVLLGADRALDPPQRVAGEQVVDPVQRLEELLAGVGEALAEGGGLRRDVVGAAGHHQVGVLGGPLGQTGEGGEHPAPHQHQRPAHLELLDVLGEVAGGHPLVDLLVAGEGRELVDAGLHVVTCDTFPGLDRLQVDLVDHLPVRLDGLVGHRDAEIALGLAGRPATAPAPAPPCARATTAGPCRHWRNGRRARWARWSGASILLGRGSGSPVGGVRGPDPDHCKGKAQARRRRREGWRSSASAAPPLPRHGPPRHRPPPQPARRALRAAPVRGGGRPVPAVREHLLRSVPRLLLRREAAAVLHPLRARRPRASARTRGTGRPCPKKELRRRQKAEARIAEEAEARAATTTAQIDWSLPINGTDPDADPDFPRFEDDGSGRADDPPRRLRPRPRRSPRVGCSAARRTRPSRSELPLTRR